MIFLTIFPLAVVVLLFLMLHNLAHNTRYRRILCNWEPNRVFYKTIVIPDDKYDLSYREYTKMGKWLQKIPGVISGPFLLMYYVPAYIIWCICVVFDVVWNALSSPVFRE